MVTNQDGLGTSRFPETAFTGPHRLMLKAFESAGITFADVHIDRSMPDEQRPTRKPGTAMLTRYLDGSYDLANSYVIGDRLTDIELAKNLGTKGILLGSESRLEEVAGRGLSPWCQLVTRSWDAIYNKVCNPARTAEVKRKTNETDIKVKLEINGTGHNHIQTGIGFFDHMLDQLGKHGMMDLDIQVTGDLHVDEHHTIEDTALALGEALRLALGDKKGLERYGFCLPMDDCMAQVAIDFGGRPWLVWNASFTREKIGEMPTEMFSHFFKSLSDAARCTIHIQAEGQNEHHKIESIFKSFARALRQATRTDGSEHLPTTKGII